MHVYEYLSVSLSVCLFVSVSLLVCLSVSVSLLVWLSVSVSLLVWLSVSVSGTRAGRRIFTLGELHNHFPEENGGVAGGGV